jgi:hypothetical protein
MHFKLHVGRSGSSMIVEPCDAWYWHQYYCGQHAMGHSMIQTTLVPLTAHVDCCSDDSACIGTSVQCVCCFVFLGQRLSVILSNAAL